VANLLRQLRPYKLLLPYLEANQRLTKEADAYQKMIASVNTRINELTAENTNLTAQVKKMGGELFSANEGKRTATYFLSERNAEYQNFKRKLENHKIFCTARSDLDSILRLSPP
jgi:chromosome segregation ATPase